MRKYTLQKTWTNTTTTNTHQLWYYKQGDYEGQYFDKYWEVVVKNDTDTGYAIPVKYTENFLASEDNTHEVYTNHFYNVVEERKGNGVDGWFQVPEFC